MKPRIDLEPLVRFMEHLPKNGDLELSLLKGHLLIEEVLTKLISRGLKHPQYLSKARLSFSQKVVLARSLSRLDKETWLWGALKKLNEARNELAHGLDAESIQKKLGEFVTFVEAEQGAPDLAVLSKNFGSFHHAIHKVFVLLASHAHFTLPPVTILTLDMSGSDTSAADED